MKKPQGRPRRPQQKNKRPSRQKPAQQRDESLLRLNKYISDFAQYSRREADRLIEAGRVTVDGERAVIGTQVSAGQTVAVDGETITPNKKKIYIALHKPAGITCTTDVNISGNLTTFMNYPEMIFPIGRLDKDSTGLLLMTNDGDIVNKILREENGHDKEYLVTVNHKINQQFIQKMASGVTIFNPVANKRQQTKPCKVHQISPYSFKIILQQGLNRQIRRMAQALGHTVTQLKRVRVMNIHLHHLPEGDWRYLTEKELLDLNHALNTKRPAKTNHNRKKTRA